MFWPAPSSVTLADVKAFALFMLPPPMVLSSIFGNAASSTPLEALVGLTLHREVMVTSLLQPPKTLSSVS